MKTYKQLKNEYYVFVDNKFFTEEYQDKFSCESILLLSLIQKNLTIRNKYIFNLKYLYDVLGVKNNNSTQKKKIKNCLIQLQKNNIITSDTNIAKANNNQLIFVDVKIPKSNYTIVYDFELDTIINYKQENLYNLFNLFVFLKYRAGVKKYCYWKQEDIAYSIGLRIQKR